MGFRIFDPSRGTLPEIKDTHLTKKTLKCSGGSDIEYFNGYLYTLDNGGLFRISSADTPEITLGEISGLGNLRQIELAEISGRIIAAVTAREYGLYLIDVTDPASPFIACHYDSVEFATGAAFYGNYLFIGCRSFGVEIINVEIPENPRHVSVIRAGEVQSLSVSDGILCTGSWGEREINVIDVSDLLSPKQLSKIPLDGRGDGVFIKDGILFAAFGQHLRPCTGNSPDEYGYGRGNGFAIYDISNPLRPEMISHTLFEHQYYCCNWDMWDITLSSHYAILSHTFNGVFIYDVADMRAPKLVEHISIETDCRLGDMITINEYIMTRRPPIMPFDHDKVSFAPVGGVAVGNGKLWIASHFANLCEAEGDYFLPEKKHSEGLELTERGNGFYLLHPGDNSPESMKIVGNIGQVHAAAELDGRIYAACGNAGVKCFSPDLSEEISTCAVGDYASDIHISGGLLYVSAGSAGIFILKPDDGQPKTIGRFYEPGMAFAQCIPAGKYIIAQADDQELFIIDAADKASPELVLRETYEPGLIYYRHITENGSGGCFGCFWNSNSTHWYDLTGDKPIKLQTVQGRLGFGDGVTGLSEKYKALAVLRGGYVLHDIREDMLYSDMPLIKLPGVYLRGKPVIYGDILAVNDRLTGNVVICDISKPEAPKLLAKLNFSGHPDIACISGNRIYLPLGHQGLGVIDLKISD